MRRHSLRAMSSLPLLQLAAAASAQAAPDGGCGKSDSGEVIVCGNRQDQDRYRLPKLPEKYEGKSIRAETDVIPGVHTRAHVESETMIDGQESKKLLVTFTIPF